MGGSVGHVDRGKRQVVLGLGMKGRGPDDLSVRTKVGVSVMWASEYLKIKKQNNNFFFSLAFKAVLELWN